MKTLFFSTVCAKLSLPLLLLAMAACSSNEETIYEGYGMIKKESGNTFSIILDNGVRLHPSEGITTLNSLQDSTRVRSTFSILKENENYSYVNLMALDTILTLPVIPYDNNILNNMGNAPISITNAWIAYGFLNFEFLFMDNQKQHKFSLMQYPSTKDKLIFELRHNDYNDEAYQTNMQVISFRLQSILKEAEKPAKIIIKYNRTDNMSDDIELTYR